MKNFKDIKAGDKVAAVLPGANGRPLMKVYNVTNITYIPNGSGIEITYTCEGREHTKYVLLNRSVFECGPGCILCASDEIGSLIYEYEMNKIK